MKKKILLLMCIVFILLGTGCGNSAPVNKQDTTPSDNLDNAQVTDMNENKTDRVELKTFKEVYNQDGLKQAVDYLNKNYDKFDNELLDHYKLSLAQQISNRANQYEPLISMEPVEGPAPRTIENVDWLYQDRYSAESNTLFINGLSDDVKNAAISIQEDEFFTLCKKYYVIEGVIEDMGFGIMVDKEIYNILMDRYSDYSDDLNSYFGLVKSYTNILESSDTKLESTEKYPIVLIHETSQIELLRNEWKVEVLIPVNFEDQPSQNNTSENKFDALTLEERMERVLNDANQYTWGFDDGILSAKDTFVSALILNGQSSGDIKTYINETYIYEIPTSLDFNLEEVYLEDAGYKFEFNGETYAFLYNNIFNENIKAQNSVEIWPFDPPIIDTTLVSIDEIYENIYRITGSYDGYEGLCRIEVTVEYSNLGMIIKSVERFEDQTNATVSSGIFRIKEVNEYPENVEVLEFLNPAYVDEPIENFTKYIFMINGKFDSVRLSTQKSMGLEEEYDLDLEGGDVALVYYTMFPTDFSNDLLIIRSAISGYEYEMQLNDAVDRDLYLFEEK